MDTDLVAQLDDAWRRLGLRNRMELFRRSLQVYLTQEGEAVLAEAIAVKLDQRASSKVDAKHPDRPMRRLRGGPLMKDLESAILSE